MVHIVNNFTQLLHSFTQRDLQCIVMSQKAKISITIDNVMHLAIPGANAITIASQGLHTTPHYNHSNCIVIDMLEMFKKKGCEVVLCEGL